MRLKLFPKLLYFFLVAVVLNCGKKEEDPPVTPNPPNPNTGTATVATSAATDITGNSAKVVVGVSVTGSLELLSKGVCWSTLSPPAVGADPSGAGPWRLAPTIASTDPIAIPGLSINTKVYVRGFAIDKQQKVYYGNEVSFTTSSVPVLKVETANIASFNGTTAEAGYTVYFSTISKPITAKGVVWKASPGPTLTDNKVDRGPKVPSGNERFQDHATLTGLSPGTTYYVRGFAVDEGGQTAYGEERSFTTLAIGVLALTPKKVFAEKVILSGEVTGTGTITKRGFAYSDQMFIDLPDLTKPSGAVRYNVAPEPASIGTFDINTRSLVPARTYYVRAYAIDQAQAQYKSDLLTFRTADTMKLVLRAPDFTTSTSTVFTYTAEGGMSSAFETGVCWSTSPNPTVSGDYQVGSTGLVPSKGLTMFVEGLSPKTQYYARAFAKTDAGQAFYSDSQIVLTTGGDEWLKVTTTDPSNIQPASATVGGKVAAGANSSLAGSIAYRGVLVSQSPDETVELIGPGIIDTNTGLGSFSESRKFDPSTTYYAKAFVITRSNSGGTPQQYIFYGTEEKFTTKADNTIGTAVFYAKEDLACGNVTVTIGSLTGIITTFKATAPACGATGFATFSLKEGTYDFVARCTKTTWSGKITVERNKCATMGLYKTITPTTPPGETGGNGSGSGSECSYPDYEVIQLVKLKKSGPPNNCDGYVQAFFKNTASVSMDVCYALEFKSGKWDTGSMVIRAGETYSLGSWTCGGTGRVKWWARVYDGKSCGCPDP